MNGVAEITLTVIFSLLTLLTILLAVWLIIKNIGKEKGAKVGKALASVLSLGVVLRVLLALFISGNRFDLSLITTAVSYFSESGFADYYELYGVELYPIAYYLFGAFGSVASLFGAQTGSVYMAFAVKLPLIIADICSALVLFATAKKYLNSQTGVIIMSLVAFCPAFFIPSAVWGAQEVLCVPLLLLSLKLLIDKKNFASIIVYSIAMLANKIALYAFPLYAVYYAYYFVIALRRIGGEKAEAIKNEKAFTIKEIMANDKTKAVVIVPLSVVVSFVLQYLLSLPLALTSFNANPFVNIYQLFLLPLASAVVFSFNGLGVYTVFGKNMARMAEGFPIVIFVIALSILCLFIVSVVYFSKKNRASTPLIMAFITYTVITYGFNTTTNMIVPVLFLLLLSFIFTKDRRILSVMMLSTVAFVMASMSVLANGNFLNALSSEAFNGSTLYELTSVTKGVPYILLIVSSILSTLAHLLFALVVFDITMNDNRKVLPFNQSIKPFKSIKVLFTGREE